MKLIVVASPVPLPMEQQLISQLFEHGLETLHLRKPGFSLEEMRKFIAETPAQYHSRLMLHSHHELAQEFEVKGLHFPEAIRASAATTPKDRLLFSTSFHQLQNVLKPQPLFDYVFLSPIFDSISKEGYQAAFAPEDLQRTVRQAKVPLVALGGVNLSSLEAVQKMGFAGAAVLGAVWQAEEPVKTFLELQRLVNDSEA
ncbi:thiamine phosphate synthase [Pontibacter silvestris]|uniref:Thiamine phosphate synthase n=1 Tax=Pontibacter silvestris TaxID=2305183 RepID=A0ABW4X5T2_9BACT|nr:thiamine phosphate synthase [Pontibacter silvestris]MCC9137952.1 thiamine phosphate synthase [Pontibacter silvestris]